MREYSNKISFTKNSRGIYSLDTTIGCTSGTIENKKGCYNDCYASRIAKIYGYDFSKTVKRDFENIKHLYKIRREIKRIKFPFIRMGTMGDPSEDWEHTIKICELIQFEEQLSIFYEKPKEIVIITKHWTNLTESQMIRLSKMNICINTSISALDNENQLNNCLVQYETLKKYCKSILRIVSFDFNLENEKGLKYHNIQKVLFDKYTMLDTVFRSSKNNILVTDGIIKIKQTKFLGKNTLVSKYNKKTFFGKCKNCQELCGVNM
jgi:hypothetical protein